MTPLLTHPLALFTLLTIPALAAIYLLHNRFKRRQVAGLFLWRQASRSRDGGMRLSRIRTPLLFIIELLILIALTIAAIDPRTPSTTAQRTLIVILDNSASMLAGSPAPRDRALPAIHKIIHKEHFRSISFILANNTPSIIDSTQNTHWRNTDLLRSWTCHAPLADINAAIALATELSGGHQAMILVVSDHKPATEPNNNSLRWIALGKPLPNIGFINARLSRANNKNRLFVTIANNTPNNIQLKIPITAEHQIIRNIQLKIPHNNSKSAIISLPPINTPISLQLPDDQLTIDNTITLLPPQTPRISTAISINNPTIRSCVQRAINATELCTTGSASNSPPDLIIQTTRACPTKPPLTILHIQTPTNAPAYRAPFVINHNHPLTQGLDFDGIIWSASPTNNLPGDPIILAGNTPLLTELNHHNGQTTLSLQIDPAASNLTDTPTWPALIYNICQYAAKKLPGPQHNNYPTDTSAAVTLPPETHSLSTSFTPNCTSRQRQKQNLKNSSKKLHQSNHNTSISIPLPQPGIYTITASPGGQTYSIASQFLAPHESDLSHASSGDWGNWHTTQTLIQQYRSLAWIAAITALLLITIHTMLTAVTNRRNNS